MSADNFYLVRLHPGGKGFCAVEGFASDDETPEATWGHTWYETVEAALASLEGEWSEYGTSVHPECEALWRRQRVDKVAAILDAAPSDSMVWELAEDIVDMLFAEPSSGYAAGGSHP